MILVLSAAFGAALWVLLWGLGAKAIDAMMLSLLLLILAITAHLVLPFLPGKRSADETQPDAAPYT
jgi:fatty acid desaturase